ncbi:uroporphyrinogen-III synthase [Legionella clemsonensis]|uniref:Uroporphyrinogen-III synthase n=1 Tax=Legionella clemsonensis TaxID=1867846 RepID=A0A222NZM6_9GAMM|nr:uroporphyrinogen-III synthase [Legionella clemsonensis]ASQ45050.1 Uroporphyrinogen-III synthase [Legionella clemsonensis]
MNYCLQGLSVLNTRPLAQGKSLSDTIVKAGGIAIECPALAIEPIEFSLPELNNATFAIFISANAVTYLLATLTKQKIQWPKAIKVIAVGHATAAILEQYGIKVDFIPQESTSESLLQLDCLQDVANKSLFLFKGKNGRADIAQTLISKGADLTSIDVYKRVMPEFDQQYLHSLWQENAVDIILFTSQQAMQNIFTMFGKKAHDWLCHTPCLVISNRLAKAAALLGIQQIIVSSPETVLQRLHQFNQGLVHGK